MSDVEKRPSTRQSRTLHRAAHSFAVFMMICSVPILGFRREGAIRNLLPCSRGL